MIGGFKSADRREYKAVTATNCLALTHGCMCENLLILYILT
jgi:hypothetical protein